jgi:Methyltransferase domain
VNQYCLDGALDFTCIEPYPRKFLMNGVPGITRLVQKRVEEVERSFFDRLEAGDILFIDSSHVAKTGSDVNYLFFEILPRLRKGVIVHFHDIFLPDEYPRAWVIDQGRNWNEQYILRAFLQYNTDWRVVWSAHLMGTRHRDAVQQVFPRYPALGGGGSFWIQRN